MESQGKQAIIDRIISSAQAQAKSIVDEALKNAENVNNAAKEKVRDLSAEQKEITKTDAENLVVRRQTVARLDANKLLLGARRDVINGIYEKALDILCALPESDYVAFIEKLLVKYAESGDVVIFSSACRFTDKLKKLSVIANKNLKISEKSGAFSGGLILESGICDKNLTFEAILSEERERGEGSISEELF